MPGSTPCGPTDTCDVIEAVRSHGRERAVDAFDVGTATLRIQNPDGLWDYPPTSELTPVVVAARPHDPCRRHRRRTTRPTGCGPAGSTPPNRPMTRRSASTSSPCRPSVRRGRRPAPKPPALTTPVGDGETVTTRHDPLRRRRLLPDASPTVRHVRCRPGSVHRSVAASVHSWTAPPRSAAGDVYGDANGNLDLPQHRLADERRPDRRHHREPWPARRSLPQRVGNDVQTVRLHEPCPLRPQR